MRYLKYLLVVTILCIACNPKIKKIDLSNTEEHNSTVNAEDIFESIDFVPLEYRNECILRNPSVFAVDERSVFVWDGDNIFRFSLNGEFCNRIGAIGKGHGEHGHLNSATYDRKRHIVLLGTHNGTIYKYDQHGNYIGQFRMDFKDELLQAVKWNNEMDCLVCEVRKYSSKGLVITLRTISIDGKIINSYMAYSDHNTIKVNMLKTGMLRNGNNGIYFKLPFDNRLLFLSSKGLSTAMIFDFGKYSSNRRDIEDIDYSYRRGETTRHIENMVIADKYIFLSIVRKNSCQEVIVDIGDNSIKHNLVFNDANPCHLKISGMDTFSFWPWLKDSNMCVDLVPIEQFSTKEMQHFKKRRFIDKNIPKSELNPVLVIGKIKE